MYRVAVGCDSARPLSNIHCPSFEPPAHVKFDEVAGWIEAALEENGWITVGEQHFCPEHNPALSGKVATVRGGEYTEIAPGVRVRIASGISIFELPIEVQTQYRECHGCVGEVCGGGNGVYEPGSEWAAWHKPDEKGR